MHLGANILNIQEHYDFGIQLVHVAGGVLPAPPTDRWMEQMYQTSKDIDLPILPREEKKEERIFFFFFRWGGWGMWLKNIDLHIPCHFLEIF